MFYHFILYDYNVLNSASRDGSNFNLCEAAGWEARRGRGVVEAAAFRHVPNPLRGKNRGLLVGFRAVIMLNSALKTFPTLCPLTDIKTGASNAGTLCL